MWFEIVENGGKIVERFSAPGISANPLSAFEEAIAYLRSLNNKNYGLFVLPLRYKVDPDNPHDAMIWSRLGNYWK